MGDESQFEGISYDAVTDTFVVLRETMQHDRHGLVRACRGVCVYGWVGHGACVCMARRACLASLAVPFHIITAGASASAVWRCIWHTPCLRVALTRGVCVYGTHRVAAGRCRSRTSSSWSAAARAMRCGALGHELLGCTPFHTHIYDASVDCSAHARR
jgi:hypothetical protein